MPATHDGNRSHRYLWDWGGSLSTTRPCAARPRPAPARVPRQRCRPHQTKPAPLATRPLRRRPKLLQGHVLHAARRPRLEQVRGPEAGARSATRAGASGQHRPPPRPAPPFLMTPRALEGPQHGPRRVSFVPSSHLRLLPGEWGQPTPCASEAPAQSQRVPCTRPAPLADPPGLPQLPLRPPRRARPAAPPEFHILRGDNVPLRQARRGVPRGRGVHPGEDGRGQGRGRGFARAQHAWPAWPI